MLKPHILRKLGPVYRAGGYWVEELKLLDRMCRQCETIYDDRFSWNTRFTRR